jgi:hypothetical protein
MSYGAVEAVGSGRIRGIGSGPDDLQALFPTVSRPVVGSPLWR